MSDWISVKEKMPENTDFVLVYIPENDGQLDSKVLACAWFDEEWVAEIGAYDAEQVTHWMPLPDAPSASVTSPNAETLKTRTRRTEEA